MIAIEVSINGQRACLAGTSGVVWLTAHWGCFVKAEGELKMRIGGREFGQPKGGEFYHWPEHLLKLGDEVSFRFVETDSVDPPMPGPPAVMGD